MDDSRADILTLARWIRDAAGFAVPPAEMKKHTCHPEAWRDELNELVLLGRSVSRSSLDPQTKRALEEAMCDGEAELHYLTYHYLPLRDPFPRAGSSSELM
ncbi:MAG: hypothetical protein RL681_610 [Candidatus Parcubacteria bacterium]|jgi:hypothetical protein